MKPEEPFVRVYERDPLLRLLLDKWRVTQWEMWFLLIILAILDLCILAPLAGYFHTRGNVLGAIEDIEYLVTLFIGIPIFWKVYVWMPSGISHLFRQLREGRVIIEETEGDYRQFVQEMEDAFNMPLWAVVAFVAAVLVQIWIVVINQQYEPTWNFLPTWRLYLFRIPLGIATLYALNMVVIRAVLMILWLRKLAHSFDIVVYPFHIDRAGGWGSLGSYSLNLTYLIAVLGVLIVMMIFRPVLRGGEIRWTFPILLSVSLYMTMAPICFFAPLWATHDAMKAVKQKRLSQIVERVQVEYEKVHDQISNGLEPEKQDLDKLDQLQGLYQLTQSLPEWPFNASLLRNFGISWATMIIIPFILEVVCNFIFMLAR